jgi:hypothetical protein
MTWVLNALQCNHEKQRRNNVMVSLPNHLTDPARKSNEKRCHSERSELSHCLSSVVQRNTTMKSHENQCHGEPAEPSHRADSVMQRNVAMKSNEKRCHSERSELSH